LIEYITSGPVAVAIAEGENGVRAPAELMGATDPR